MKERRFTLEELEKEVNLLLENTDLIVTDSRQSKSFSQRRIRDLSGKDILNKPLKDGVNAYYTEDHLNELLEVKKLQLQGLSDKSLRSLKMSTSDLTKSSELTEDDSNKEGLNDLISSIKANTRIKPTTPITRSLTQDSSNLDNEDLFETLSSYCSTENLDITGKSNSIPSLKKIGFPTNDDFDLESIPKKTEIEMEEWNEYKLSDSTVLKFKKGSEMDDLHKVIEQIKQIHTQIKGK